MQTGTMMEPLDCTTPALDLCTRRERSHSPNPEGANQGITNVSPDTNIHLDSTKQDFTKNLYFSPESDEISSDEKSSVNSDIINHNDFSPFSQNFTSKTKTPRPFKAYPKDPFFLALGASTADALLGQESAEAYAEFRNKMLVQVRANNPPPGVTNTKMRRSSNQSLDGKDQSYWEKRRKNNEAAKRSRDARRAKEDEIAIRAAFLEQENLKLKYEIAALRNEIAKQRCIMYN